MHMLFFPIPPYDCRRYADCRSCRSHTSRREYGSPRQLCLLHAVSKANPSGKSLLVAGVGTIGQMAVEIAKYLGCTRLFAVDISDEKLEESQRRGADVLINGMKEDLVQVIKRETDP